MRRMLLIPAVFIGCLVVISISIFAVSNEISWVSAQAEQSQTKAEKDLLIQNNPQPTCTLSDQYPEKIRQWCPIIESASQTTGLPSSLIAAVMLQESGGNPLAYSSSGAVGLMQVMPRDGLAADFMCINGPCFADRPTIAQLQDPAFNIDYGSRMLADLLSRHGTYREALFRYGPMDIGYRYADLVLNIWESY